MISGAGEIYLQLPDRRIRGRWIEPSPSPQEAFAPVLVFLHEGLGCIEMWRGFPDGLCARTGLRGFLFDRTGYGRSSRWPSAPGTRYMDLEADPVLPQVLDAAGVEACVLIGHGDGGTIALDFASAQPPLLRGVVAIGAHVMTEPRTISSIRQAREAFLANDLRERLVCYHGENVDEAFSLWADAWLAPGFEPMDAGARLPRVRVPVLALQGERDEYSTVAQLHAIARSVSGRCETRVMPGCGHGPHLQDPDTLVDVVARFIATLWRSPRGSAVITAGVTLLTVALLSAGSATAADASACPENLERVFGEARHDENRVDDGAAAGRLAAANEQASGCAELALAALVLEGWVEARRLALVGGAPGELVRINGILARISAVPATLSRAALLSRSAMYAEAVLRAGVAAAQDERDEMQLYLAHARTLADSLRFGSPARPWPLPIDLVAAELWLEVDRFAEARAAFERVTDPELAGRVALGTAQVLERLDDVIAACGAYRRAAASPLVPIATERAKLAVIRLKCGR